MNKRNDFICIGAVHTDNILRLKQVFFRNRTNPVNQKENLGGVAYNVAKILAFLNIPVILYSLNCNNLQKKEIAKKGINFIPLNKDINKSYYTSVLNRDGKMILGLANMDTYEEPFIHNSKIKLNNKKIILDLNFSKDTIQKIVNNNYKNNYICVCGTSAHKIYKIKNLINKIDTIILNKQESLSLTKKDNVEDSIGYLVKKNKRINIIVTDGKNAVNSYLNKKKYKSYPPHTKIKNENGAGDVLNAIFNYFFFQFI